MIQALDLLPGLVHPLTDFNFHEFCIPGNATMLQLQQRSRPESLNDPEELTGGEWTTYLPSQEEIERCCREIRRSWSESEHRRRAGVGANRLRLAILPCRTHLPGRDHNPRDFEVLS